MIAWTGEAAGGRGYAGAALSRGEPSARCEAEAFNRSSALAAFIDQPIMIFHVSTAEGAARIRAARGEGLKVFAKPVRNICS